MNILFDQGERTAEDRTMLALGQLVSSIGAMYKPDSKLVHKIPGRTVFGDTGSAAVVWGLNVCTFDSGSDVVVAGSGTSIYSAPIGDTGTFTEKVTSLTQPTQAQFAHAQNRWYMVDGVNPNRVIEEDGTFRLMGMEPPSEQLTAVAELSAGSTGYPTAHSDTGASPFYNEGNAYDGDPTTFAHTRVFSSASDSLCIFDTFTEPATTGRFMYVDWRLMTAGPWRGDDRDTWAGLVVDVTFSYWDGLGWEAFMEKRLNSATAQIETMSKQLPDLVNITDLRIKVEASMTVQANRDADLQIFSIRVSDGGTETAFSTRTDLHENDNGFLYCVCEFDETRGLQSEPAHYDATDRTTFEGKNAVRLTMPTSANNSNTTHWRIYRTPDGGADPWQLGKLADVPVADTEFLDDFQGMPKDVLGYPPIPLVRLSAGDTHGYIFRDAKPPMSSAIAYFKGSLVLVGAVDKDDPGRVLFFTMASSPESVPEVYNLRNLPFEEHDKIIALQRCGETLLVAGQDIVIAFDDIPRLMNGLMVMTPPRTLDGQPGCVGRHAMAPYTLQGEPRAAWVSQFGIFATNGSLSWELTHSADWDAKVSTADLSTATLDWDKERKLLIMSYDSDGGGTNDRYALLHMFDTGENGVPRITWGHYGSINVQDSASSAGVFRLFSGHTSNGIVYLENNGNQDYSNSYDGSGNIRFDIRTGRIYQEIQGREIQWSVGKVKVKHTDGGVGETVTFTWTAGFDEDDESHSEAATLPIAGQKGDEVYIGLAGEWHDIRIEHSGKADFAILDCKPTVSAGGPSGQTTAP